MEARRGRRRSDSEKKISDQLRAAIDTSGMSRYRICKEIGLAESTMSRFMSRRCGLSVQTIDKLGELLGLELVLSSKNRPASPGKGS